jgi:hypothetical protein
MKLKIVKPFQVGFYVMVLFNGLFDEIHFKENVHNLGYNDDWNKNVDEIIGIEDPIDS